MASKMYFAIAAGTPADPAGGTHCDPIPWPVAGFMRAASRQDKMEGKVRPYVPFRNNVRVYGTRHVKMQLHLVELANLN